jgi:NAD(P)-dependent dehydrogenase (short-subunit alcohol dehydrogenase family)
MSESAKKVWLITGSGGGLGRVTAEAALAAGHCVVASARRVDQLDELAAKYGDQVLPFELDVTDEAQGKAAVQAAVRTFGRLDVLVNNAGYGDSRAFEEIPSEDFRRLVETCFFGVVNLSRAAVPVMRRQRSGHIIQISSVGGRIALAGNAAYFASKWAVGGFTESLAQEVAPFGVKAIALEPGGMHTNWGKRAYTEQPTVMPDYEATVGARQKQFEGYWGNEAGDPKKVAQLILQVAQAETLPYHLLLGSDALEYAQMFEQARAQADERWKAVSVSTDVATSGPIPAFPE